MKIRIGFVSNSSSSSFTISKDDLTELQIALIKNHSEEGAKYGIAYPEDAWNISETDTDVEGYTSMDNFNMEGFMKRIGINTDKADWSHS